ncbi:Spy/CpxP family protein refolding chaperone [Xenorhabdus sp. ZM]|uniref:Spy/CpxP family protein refolding chaperone n=1 Tax=Xenorhabdus szentirmaii TaxID=290112 RepID=UPI0019C0E878|nr:Spy/CpxP family protein refolding chaperone [Xenorhabdus sp. ZM]MBD2804155.1 Spy/CpxP family protein refolding chaperone [Xenorhabdus sp. ZM]
MRNIAILALGSIVVLGATLTLAETADTDDFPEAARSSPSNASQYCRPYSHRKYAGYHHGDEHNYSYLFDGIILTEQQRQQMWDLVKQKYLHESTLADIRDEHQKMHNLLIEQNFDEIAVREQLEKIAKKNVELGIESARIRNQLYQLLTPEQKELLQKRCEERMALGIG